MHKTDFLTSRDENYLRKKKKREKTTERNEKDRSAGGTNSKVPINAAFNKYKRSCIYGTHISSHLRLIFGPFFLIIPLNFFITLKYCAVLHGKPIRHVSTNLTIHHLFNFHPHPYSLLSNFHFSVFIFKFIMIN